MEKDHREALLKAYKSAKSEVGFKHFRRAAPHVSYKNGELIVQISLLDRASFWYDLIAAPLLFFSGLFLAIAPIYMKEITLTQGLGLVAKGSVFIGVAFYMLIDMAPVISARKIARVLEEDSCLPNPSVELQAQQ